MNTRPPNGEGQTAGVRRPDPHRRAEAERRVQCRDRHRRAGEPVGAHVPAQRQDARDREARPAARRERRRQAALRADGRPAGGGHARPGRSAGRRHRSGVCHQSADLLELRRAWRRGREQHRRGPRPVRGRRGTEGRERPGDLPPGAVAGVAAALRRPARVRARRHPVRHDGRPVDHAGPHAGAEHGQPDRQDRSNQRRRLGAEGQSVRRQAGRAAGDLVDRPPQQSRPRRCIRPPASCGKWSTARAAATS